jgi:hypothetical protein
MDFDTKKPEPTEEFSLFLEGGVAGGGGGGGGVVVAKVGLRSLKQFTTLRIAAADLPRFQLSL